MRVAVGALSPRSSREIADDPHVVVPALDGVEERGPVHDEQSGDSDEAASAQGALHDAETRAALLSGLLEPRAAVRLHNMSKTRYYDVTCRGLKP